ncbi:uncharacterized protein LOC115685922 [Syzygium oleosum]|uniref:uncharacterized protein LOC115685922 n=1 Tax=Syzygium oleosum TaxID=219896 RepID=UPI0024B9C636|nr:uncharacterized protein LOC115685922 [Syzygium oleosum]
MAGYGNRCRSNNPYDGFDPWKAERSHDSEQLRCSALDESEGRRMIAVDPYQNPGTYVMKTETTVESVHPSMFSESYRQCSPPRYNHHPSYGVVHKLHGPSIPSNDRPPVVEELLLLAEELFNIQNEVSRPSGFGATRAPYQLRIPVSSCYYGTTGSDGDSDQEKQKHKPTTKTIKDKDREADKILKPPVTTEGDNRPRRGHPTGSMLPSHHISPERERTIQPPSLIMTGRREGRGHDMGLDPMNEIGKTMEYSKEAAKPSLGSAVPKRDSIPETIDSKEARRRYGNVKSSPEMNPTVYTTTINSREAARKYGGEFV